MLQPTITALPNNATADMENTIIIVMGIIIIIMFSLHNAFISNEELSSNIDTQGMT